jgi:hypothetical protein
MRGAPPQGRWCEKLSRRQRLLRPSSTSASGTPTEALIRWPWWISLVGVFSPSLWQPPLAASPPRVAETHKEVRGSAVEAWSAGGCSESEEGHVRRAAVGALGAWCGRCRGRREPREAAAGAGGGRWLPVPSVVARGELRVSSGGGGRGVAADGDAGGGRE